MADQDTVHTDNLTTGLTNAELQTLLKHFETKSIKKKTILLNARKTAKEVYYIINGCLRLFYIKDGLDISSYFFTEAMFAGAYESFISQQPSRQAIETIEDCELVIIPYAKLQGLYTDQPEMNSIVRKIVEQRFVSLHKLFTSYILDSPEERYLYLLKENPGLLNRVPQHHIATFLGITPVSLSRIRNRVRK
jgi:CRP-like cAMP-binding protein